jgi:hypothetical protein
MTVRKSRGGWYPLVAARLAAARLAAACRGVVFIGGLGHRTLRVTPLAPLALLIAANACSILDPLRAVPVRIDSLRVVAASGVSVPSADVFVYGKVGGSYCDKVTAIRRLSRPDSLLRMFVATEGRGLCAASPSPLRYEERVTRVPGRTLTYVVAQPGAPPVSVTIAPP